ncbi:hypothetical protein [Cellvibrio sp. pealriver]|nr:hypothetical protein [Cellvibrio sp. pealriver]
MKVFIVLFHAIHSKQHESAQKSKVFNAISNTTQQFRIVNNQL